MHAQSIGRKRGIFHWNAVVEELPLMDPWHFAHWEPSQRRDELARECAMLGLQWWTPSSCNSVDHGTHNGCPIDRSVDGGEKGERHINERHGPCDSAHGPMGLWAAKEKRLPHSRIDRSSS